MIRVPCLLLLLLLTVAGCTGGDGEKGVNKNKEKPVEPPAEKKQ
jgi:hypothetical protein